VDSTATSVAPVTDLPTKTKLVVGNETFDNGKWNHFRKVTSPARNPANPHGNVYRVLPK